MTAGALPHRLGTYRLINRIGEGGMGVVYLAADSQDRLVAVKVLRSQASIDLQTRRRVAREVEAMRRVRSPFVAEVIDADLAGDVPYLVTRFVPGRRLDKVVADEGPLRGASLQRLAYGLATALAAMHAAGIVHRDLKPGNVMLAGDDPVVIDFGIAQVADATPLTRTGVHLGTPGYLAPEVIEGQSWCRPSSDVHSWAATVAFAARGEPLFGTGPLEALSCRIVRGTVNLDGIHGALYPLLAAALLREPTQRPSAAWLASQIAQLDLTKPVPPPTSMSLTREPAPPQRPGDGRDLVPQQRPAPPAEAVGVVSQSARHLLAAPADSDKGARGKRIELGRPRHRPLALAALVIAVAISLLLPVAGTVAVAALLTGLRAADRSRQHITARRISRGVRVTNPVLVAASMAWQLARAAVVTIMIAPLPLFTLAPCPPRPSRAFRAAR